MNTSSYRVKEFYRRHCVGVDPAVRQPDDHIGLECAFMQWLTQRPIAAYRRSFEEPADVKRVQYPLQLIGWHTKIRCHSIHFSNKQFNSVEKQELWIHPDDAHERSIQDGDWVRVWNDRACTRLTAHVTKQIGRGVVAMAQGAWYHAGADGVEQNGSINALTICRPTPLAKGNPQHSNLVEVGRESSPYCPICIVVLHES